MAVWRYNIKIYLREVGREDVHWIHLTQDMVSTDSPPHISILC
jgi:hypothetical protein